MSENNIINKTKDWIDYRATSSFTDIETTAAHEQVLEEVKEILEEARAELSKHIATTEDVKAHFSYVGPMKEVIEAQKKARWIRVEEVEKWLGELPSPVSAKPANDGENKR